MNDTQDRATVRYLNALPLVMTKENIQNPPLRLDIRKNVWTGNFRTCIMAFSLQLTVWLIQNGGNVT